MGPARGVRPAHDVDLVTADRDGNLEADHGADARSPESGGVHHARRVDRPRARLHAGDAVTVGEDGDYLGVLVDARAARAGGQRPTLGRLGRIAIARVRLVAALDEVLA